MTAPDGLLVVDKPAGWTSHDVVARCRRLCETRRVGHAGTLDPMATGVLLLGVGKATRLLGRLALADKAYDATIRLGQSTVTDDAEGDLVQAVDASGVTDDAVEAGVRALTGDIQQRPSAVSAIKIDGQRAYKRVRAGEDVELPARPVTVSRFDVLAVRRPAAPDDPPGPVDPADPADPVGRVDAVGVVDLDVHVECTTGTYIRALARDLGEALGVGGHLTRLRRVRVGGYDILRAQPMEALERGPVVVVPLARVAAETFPTYRVDCTQETGVRNGRAFKADLGAKGQVALFSESGQFLALYEQHGPLAQAVAVFVS